MSTTPDVNALASPVPSPARRHKVFYFENDQVIFLVCHCRLFAAPKLILYAGGGHAFQRTPESLLKT